MRIAFITAAATLSVSCVAWAQESAGRETVELKARPFALKQVRLLDGPFKQAMRRDRKYLYDLDASGGWGRTK